MKIRTKDDTGVHFAVREETALLEMCRGRQMQFVDHIVRVVGLVVIGEWFSLPTQFNETAV